MKELEYPFDTGWILSNRRKLKRNLLSGEKSFIEKKIAVLGGSTTASIVQMLEVFLLNYGIKASFYESEYNMYYEDAVFGNKTLADFNPDIVYVCTTNRNISRFPSMSDASADIDVMLDEQMHKFQEVWKNLRDRFGCSIIQNNFEMPLFRLLGNKDASDIHGATNFVSRLNMSFYKFAQTNDNFFICDINYISADYGLKEWSDPFYWHMYKYALNVNAIPSLAFNVANIVKSIFGKNKKGIVLDLDNTLWGGVIGDEGQENIKIGQTEPAGQVYSEFQRYIKAQKQLGIVLAIDSKNDIENALLGLSHPDSELSEDDFIEIKANWEPKDKNFSEIAMDLNLMPESLVFIDDNPAERSIVSEQIIGVSAPEIGQSHEYIVNIDRNGFFETTYLSKDDLKRNAMYQENVKRSKLQKNFADYGEYLDSLEMKAVIKPFEDLYMARIAQLTNKTNQFNLTTRRYTMTEIEEVAESQDYITLYGKLEDKFGDNGVVAVCVAHKQDETAHIDLWLMSCRVLKREMEYAMFDELVKRCRGAGITEIFGYYLPTQKNGMVKELYGELGFEKVSEHDAETSWRFAIDDSFRNRNKHIKVEVAK